MDSGKGMLRDGRAPRRAGNRDGAGKGRNSCENAEGGGRHFKGIRSFHVASLMGHPVCGFP